jgi:hypothetical protein
MNTLEKLSAHKKRWDIEIDDQAAFQVFKSRIVQDLEGYVRSWSFWYRFARKFNYHIGYTAIQLDTSQQSNSVMGERFLDLLRSAPGIKEISHYFQICFTAIEELTEESQKENSTTSTLDKIKVKLFEVFSKALGFTPEMNVEITQVNGEVILYPKGAKLLDDAVINQNLIWLESHPNVLSAFERALIHYMEGDKRKYRNLLDDLRFALEQLLKDVLKNDKSLEYQKTELLRWLEAQGVHKQTINMYHALLFGPYSQFQNDAVKHGEEFTENDIEFTIYMTGTFMRLLLQLEQTRVAKAS